MWPPGHRSHLRSVYQKYLWFVDELEAQWQSTLKEYPTINHMELDWDKKLTPEYMAWRLGLCLSAL